MDMMDWNTEKKLDIVEKCRKYPMLWRSSDKHYKSRKITTTALQELGEKY
jgi:hypothetical protein